MQALRDAITETLYSVSAYHLADVCAALGLAPPQGDDPMSSKRSYVQRRLVGKSLDELTELAHRVVAEYSDEHVGPLLPTSHPRGPDGEVKNIIFAADGPKPHIVLRNAITNEIQIVEGAGRCLVYDRPLSDDGLTWDDLVAWWVDREQGGDGNDDRLSLAARLERSLDDGPELQLFRTYRTLGKRGPALLPQVYLHYDPYSAKRLGNKPGPLRRQRMDFLMLLPGRARVVIEIDGQQHYSQNGQAKPTLYAEMVMEDRELRLAGYEIYRFGGSEFVDKRTCTEMLNDFFHRLLARHKAEAG